MKSQLQVLHASRWTDGHPLRDWLVPHVLFPRFLFLLIVGYVIRGCADSLKETAMRYVTCIVALATLAVGGCADPYYPRYGNSQSYYSPSGYSYPATYSYPVSYSYPANYNYPSNYNRSTAWDRNYNGIHPGPERTFP